MLTAGDALEAGVLQFPTDSATHGSFDPATPDVFAQGVVDQRLIISAPRLMDLPGGNDRAPRCRAVW